MKHDSVLIEESVSQPSPRETLPPTGPAAAAIMAAGIGCGTLGVATLLAEANASVGAALNWSQPVGPLAGKTGIAVLAFLISWVLLGLRLRNKQVRLGRWAAIAFGLIALGFLLTFPPVFDLFA